MSSTQIADGLMGGELDAGLTYLDNDPLPDVETLALWREHYLLLTADDAPFAGAVTVAWRCASTLRLCLLTPDMQHRRIVDAAFAAAGARPDPAVETNSISTLIAHAGTACPASRRTAGSTATRSRPACARLRSSIPSSSIRSGS